MPRSIFSAPRLRTFTAALVLSAIGMAAQASVLILGAPQSGAAGLADVQSKLSGTGQIAGSIDVFNVASGTPTLAQLTSYDAVLVFSDAKYFSAVNLGNVLADFVDAGGGVVEAGFSHFSVGLGGLSGRFVTGNYDVFNNSLGQPGCGSLGSIVNAGSPLMTGVSSLDSGYGANCNRVTLKAGATLVASWSTGQPMAATRTDHAAPVVGINLYPVSSSVSAELWNASTDGARLFANALNYVGAAPLAVVPEPGSLALAGLAVLAAFTVRRRRA